MKKQSTQYTVKENNQVQGPYYRLVLENFPSSTPGQFVNILCQPDERFHLRRPFSIERSAGEDICILYKVIGEGTRLLSKRKAGDILDVIGPLGNGWRMENESPMIHVLVGGGVGTAPLVGLAESLIAPNGPRVIVLLGGRDQTHILCEKEFRELGCEVHIATDDGSMGHHGLVTDLLENLLQKHSVQDSPRSKVQGLRSIYTCGPHPMMAAVAGSARQHQVPCQVSLEEMMGCGLGGCVCCVCATHYGYQKVCTQGPVFNGEDVLW